MTAEPIPVRVLRHRDVDPDVAHLRGKVAGFTLRGNVEAAKRSREDLDDALIIAALKRALADLPKLPESKRDRAIRVTLIALADAARLAAEGTETA